MHILLYIPDNQVTHNFMPQLWPFVLQRRTPPEHRVTIMDGNVVRFTPTQIAAWVVEHEVDLVGMGFMTRMAQKAYLVAEAIRGASRAPVVMGGPHVTAMPDEPLGNDNCPRYADAVVVGEADNLWPRVLEDTAAGRLQPLYGQDAPEAGLEKPSLDDYPIIRWDRMVLDDFDLMRFVPAAVKGYLKKLKIPFGKIYVFPMESGRGCPYGCEFCSVTGFFGEKIRFRSPENVVEELKLIKEITKRDNALAVIFFVDDNFAINKERAKALLRAMIEAGVDLNWCAQISINLLKDEELVELLARAGCRWIFIGLESIEADSLKSAHKSFNRPDEYPAILKRMSGHGVYAITSFIFGLDADRPGCARRVARTMAQWPPVMPVYCLLTPLPGTPLYQRLEAEGRLTRPRHWLDFQANRVAFAPKHINGSQLETELHKAWLRSYRGGEFARTQRWLLRNGRSFEQQGMLFVFRAIFRGIYFPQRSRWAWARLFIRNIFTLGSLVHQGISRLRKAKKARKNAAC